MRRSLIPPPTVADLLVRIASIVGSCLRKGLAEHCVDVGLTRPRALPRVTPWAPVGHRSSSVESCATTYDTRGHSVAMPSRMAARLGAKFATTVLPDTPT